MQHGTRVVGSETEFGQIQQVSLTAYLIDGTWVPFSKVDGPYKFVEPLVIFGGAV